MSESKQTVTAAQEPVYMLHPTVHATSDPLLLVEQNQRVVELLLYHERRSKICSVCIPTDNNLILKCLEKQGCTGFLRLKCYLGLNF